MKNTIVDAMKVSIGFLSGLFAWATWNHDVEWMGGAGFLIAFCLAVWLITDKYA